MKSIRWIMTVLAGAVSIGALSGVAAAQLAFDKLPKVLDASMPRDEQISLAMSAGPKEVASNATIYILGAKGYEIARQGTNGASCLVTRSFVKPNETTISPMCYDPEGSRTLLQVELYKEELRSKGVPEAEIKTAAANGYKDGHFTAPAKPGVLYMLSSDNRLGPTPDNGTTHFPGHLMFYAPYMTAKDLGYKSGAADAPYLVNAGKPDALMVVIPDAGTELK